ncbi:MAG: flagellar M-ring protein FliF [Candidatus Azotimanducaceae bacterium]|jgi:flagellar M-ring protein FliF
MSELSAVAELDEPSAASPNSVGRQQSMEPSNAMFDSPGSSGYRSNDVVSGFLGLPMLRQVGLLVGFASVITFSILIVMWSQSPDYRPLYSNLDPGQASEIARALEEGGVQFTVEPETGMVLVPASDIHEARMKIAAADVIATKDTGYLILDQEQELGTSQFMETARYRRAIEGELAKTISSLKTIKNARVLLAIPKQSVFVRDARKPSASIFVELIGGRELERQQVKSVMHLVANSIPEMSADDVTVVDQNGNLLSEFEEDSAIGETEKQFQFSQKVEAELVAKIRQILQPILGETEFNAQVAADVDFTWIEQTEEMFNPDLPSIRSEETMEETRANGEEGGIPGALSNQPPNPGAAPEDAIAGEGEATQQISRQRKQATRNYELDRTISHTRHPVGRINRLTVAVVLDHRRVVNPVSGELQTTPWEDESLVRLNQLIRDAVGYSNLRGDRVTVMNEPFGQVEPITLEIPGFWTESWFLTIVKQGMFGLLVVFLTFFVLRPVLNMLAGPSAEDRMKDLVAEQELERLAEQELEAEEEAMQETVTLSGGEELLLPGPGDMYARQLDTIKALVEENPARVAQVIKEWVSVEN